MRKTLRIILWTVGAIVCVVVAAGLVVTWFIRRPFPDVRGRETVAGISAPVEIYRDDDGVPHVWATTAEDLYFAQGYVHAQDRFWQMEFWRRIGAGRLSEILGESAVDQDRYLRTMGFARVAEQEYEQLPPELRALMDAYSRGVNSYVGNRKPGQLGLEFGLLKLTGVDIQIDPWTGVNSLSWAKIMALDLGMNMGNEFGNLSLVRFGGRQLLDLVRAPYREDMPFIVSMEEVAAFREQLGLSALPEPSEPVATVYTSGQGGIGSNNWAIAPDRTSTGAPIVANDMHLAVQLPSIWYEIGLHLDPGPGSTEDPLNLRGFSFAGVPGVVAGQNDHIAWGITNMGADVQDLHLERINPENSDQYWDGSDWQDMDIRVETIVVEGEDEPVVQRVRSTPRGPIMTDLPQMDQWFSYSIEGGEPYPDSVSFYELSLSWTALQPETLWPSLVELNRAASGAEVRAALSYWQSPAQNIVYADDEGNIGYQSTGSFPDRPPAEGRAPTPGWEHTDPGRVPFIDFPGALNPEKGYVVTANNPVISPEYPYPLGLEFANGFRASRIEDLIEDLGTGIGIDDVAGIHADVFNQSADELLPFLQSVDLSSAYDAAAEERDDETRTDETRAEDLEFLVLAAETLALWDRNMDLDSAGATAYGFVWKQLIEAALEDEVAAGFWPFAGITTFESAFHVLLGAPAHQVWDDRTTDDQVEGREDIVGRALVDGLLAARDELGSQVDSWEWGDVHRVEFRNATLGESGIGPIERLFNRGPYPLAGGASTVNVAAWRLGEPFDVVHIVSQRAIYDLADPSNSRFIHPTGQSGHPFHTNYMSFFQKWSNVEYHPARFAKDEVVLSAGRRVLRLRPENSE
jgi:penicillin G amidase